MNVELTKELTKEQIEAQILLIVNEITQLKVQTLDTASDYNFINEVMIPNRFSELNKYYRLKEKL